MTYSENGHYDHIEELDDLDIELSLEDLAAEPSYAFLKDPTYQKLRSRLPKYLPRAYTPYEKMLVWLDRANEGRQKNKNFTVDGKKSILAMAKKNDPLYAGQPYQLEGALWFAEFHHRCVGNRRFHLRFNFYLATGEYPDPDTGEYYTTYMPNGEELLKDEEGHWEWFQEISKWARNIGAVDPGLIVDKRRYNITENHILESDEPEVEFTLPEVVLPRADYAHSRVTYASGLVHGYEPDDGRVPSKIELWSEKGLDEEDNPVIRNLCYQEDVTLVEGTGYMTISTMHSLLRDRAREGKPIRIIYLADFDDAGQFMARGPARHIESAIQYMVPKPDIRLHHLALTAQQVAERGIPKNTTKKPPKKKEKKDKGGKVIEVEVRNGRKEKFEERYGAGVVQLNALTVNPVHLRWFADLLETAIYALRDPDIAEKIDAVEAEAQALVDSEVGRRFHWIHTAYDLLRERALEARREERDKTAEERSALAHRAEELRYLLGLIRQRQDELDTSVVETLAPFEERADRIREIARRRMEKLEEEIELPEVVPEEPEGATNGWLYSSQRGYFEQHHHYREHLGQL